MPATLLKYGQLLLATVGIALLLIFITALGYVHHYRVDLSPGSRFTLSDHAREVLRALDEPVKVTGFIRTEDARNIVLKDLLWQAKHETDFISYDIVDVNRNPQLAAEYGVNAYGSAVAESEKRRIEFANPSERQLISAILHVTREPKKVYSLVGHGECDIANVDRREGCSGVRSALSNEHYDVQALSLSGREAIPEDADIVIVLGPKSDLVGNERAPIDRYLAAGGKMMVLLDPFAAPTLARLLGDYGLEIANDVVLDPDNRLAGGELFSAVVTELNSQVGVTRALDSPVLLSGIRSVSSAAKGEDDVYSWFLKSGPRSWATGDSAVLGGTRPSFKPGRDLNGPFVVGAEMATPARDGEGQTRIVFYGDSEFARNRFIDYLGNRDLLVNSVNRLAREDLSYAPRSRTQQPGTNFLFVSDRAMRNVFLKSVVFLPGAFAAAGILVFLWRRVRP